ncbi:MAG: glycosyltransferase [Acidisphaera sp.]|nr:glycosyltransferase [Acidisphaera sp.]
MEFPRRVLLSADAVGGVWRYALELADGLAGQGIETVLAVLGPAPSPAQAREAQAVPGLQLCSTGLALDWTAADAEALAAAGDGLVALAASRQVDIVHLHAPALAAWTRFAMPVVVVAHSCVGTWWRAVRGGPLPADLAWRAEPTARGLRAADAVIAPSRSFAAALRAEYGELAIDVVHNGRTPLAVPEIPRERAVLTAGRLWDEAKNVALLDAAAARLDVPVYAAGPVAFENGAQLQSRSLQLLGVVDDAALRRRMAGTAVFASVSRYEPFGLAVLEAAQAGMALVLSDIPTFRELWDGAALFVSDDVEALAEALRRVLDDGESWARAARVRSGCFGAADMVRGTLAVLRKARGAAPVPSSTGPRWNPSAPDPIPLSNGFEGHCPSWASRGRSPSPSFLYFTHSLISCWNHGNAHFLRGVLRELQARGHALRVLEPADGWSRAHLLAEQGAAATDDFAAAFPGLASQTYGEDLDIAAAVDGVDVVIVHEWNPPWLIAALGRHRREGGRFLLLFHDTHHRGVSDPAALRALDLSGYDGVLAFGEALAAVYRSWGWGGRVFVWHEAADIALFHPPAQERPRAGLVWVGNWGDDERTAELGTFLFEPASALRLPLDVYGVRYPPEALATLAAHGATYRGWLANAKVPEVFARHLATVHVPRRFYASVLPGIPTIRVFEALACGIPLVCAPWDDAEGLFRPGRDYLVARTGAEMRGHLNALVHDPGLRASLAASGLETIRARHTCAHRVDELLGVIAAMRSAVTA